MRTYTDEELVAYADGELAEPERRAIAEAAQRDAALARRIAAFVDTRRALQDAFGGALREPVPARLLDLLAAPAEARDAGRVVPLPRRPRSAPRWMPMALAASLALAVGLYAGLSLRPGVPGGVIEGLPAADTLALALETRASGVPLAGESLGVRYEVVPLASLQTAAGAYCREFESRSGATRLRGLACRESGSRWAPQALARLDDTIAPADPGYAPASAGAPDLTASIGAARRLTPAEEERALRERWR